VLGEATGSPLLMIMGLGMPLSYWDDDLCKMLAGRGFRVVRFDNRDSGRSTKITDGPKPNVLAATFGITRSASYSLEDMADDAAGLLRHLGVDAAHVMGASLGGMIAQTLAIRHPARVRSLCSIMSTTGNRRVARARPRAARTLLSTPPRDRDGYIDHVVQSFRIVGSPGFPFDEARLRARLRTSFDRGRDPVGARRQLVAIAASGDRTRALQALNVPTLVVHGLEDPLVPPSAGRATAAAIPGARLLEIAGMGHDLPRDVWPQVVGAIEQNAARSVTWDWALAAS
jgi:pimeloyl-ACP methyl ester carboxylesterase